MHQHIVNGRCSGTVWPLGVASRNGSLAAVALRALGVGEVVLTLEGRVSDRPTRFSVQIGRKAHLDVPPESPLERIIERYPWRFLNHACDPAAVFDGRVLVARRAIAAGEEVTFHYGTTEWELASPFDCACGAPMCVGRMAGYAHLTAAERARIAPWTAPHLVAAFRQRAR